jgi:hypothetical protein
MQEIDGEDGDRINMSISRKAYNALVEYTRQVNEKNSDTEKKPFTVEEVLDDEIVFLFSDEKSVTSVQQKVEVKNLNA